MTAVEFLNKLRAAGIEIRADGEALRVEAPKGAMTAALAKEIREHKALLLEFLGQVSSAAGGTAPIGRRPVRGSAPMSFAQQRLWYLDQLDPGTAVYNVPVALWLQGRVDVALLSVTLSFLMERHEVLRSRFRLGDDGPWVDIADSTEVPLDYQDLRDVPAQDREAALRQALAQEAQRAFDLAAGPLVRALCLRTSEDTAVLLYNTHHVATDGWSQAIFESEFLVVYDQLHRGKTPSLPALPVQYGDYAVWQQAHLSGAVLEDQLNYWTDALSGTLPILDLPTDRPRPSMQPSSGAVEELILSEELLAPITALARAESVTRFNALVAVYAALLGRYTGQDVIVIGTPVAGRTRPELESLIGCFTNTLALRVDLTGSPSLRQLLSRVAMVVQGALAHQDLPFERLVEALAPKRDLARTPIFQTIFAFEDGLARAEPGQGQQLSVEHRETIHAGVSRTDLSVWVSRRGGSLCIAAEYCDQLFGRETVRALLEHFAGLLAATCAAPDTAIDTLSLLSATDARALLEEPNQTEMSLPKLRGFHQLFEAQAAQHPDRIAVVCGAVALSYQELDARANQLARHLDGGRNALIGVSVERSVEMLIAVLAVAKSGSGYVPLDPGYPAERLAYMIADAELESIVADAPSAAPLRLIAPSVTIIAVDEKNPGKHHPATDSQAQDIAYVIYTSGSTGKPKGVEVPHRSVINFLSSMAERPGLDANDVLLAVTTLSFDIAVLELYLPLSVGARVVIASAEQAGDGRALVKLIGEHDVSVMQATPSTWRLMLNAGWNGPAPRKVLCGGEAFPGDLLAPLCERAEVWNMYGPTETTVWSTCAKLEADGPVHIGGPIANTRVYVLDKHRQLVPTMTRGELYIAGAGVAIGYRGRRALTATRFIDDPFVPGGRMYATGDQAWWDSEGRLVCGGRLDGQVKVRGYRIELGEIETVLARHKAVEACAVMVREDRAGDQRLVGYVLPVKGEQATATELRAHLRADLPDYMIVQHVVELDALPLTPAGKVDRAALPAPESVHRATENCVAPRTPAEHYVAKLWTEVLGLERVGVHDNFFERGGHSLLSMQVIVRIDRETGARLSPRVLLLDSLSQIAARLPEPP